MFLVQVFCFVTLFQLLRNFFQTFKYTLWIFLMIRSGRLRVARRRSISLSTKTVVIILGFLIQLAYSAHQQARSFLAPAGKFTISPMHVILILVFMSKSKILLHDFLFRSQDLSGLLAFTTSTDSLRLFDDNFSGILGRILNPLRPARRRRHRWQCLRLDFGVKCHALRLRTLSHNNIIHLITVSS